MSHHFGAYSRLTAPPEPAHQCPDCDDAVEHPGRCRWCEDEVAEEAANRDREARACQSCGDAYDTGLVDGLCRSCEQIERDWI